MISSRRLAREWALKILYQMDIGGSSMPEARDSALERLRTEFVQRGSRYAVGSTAELICLDYVTCSLSEAVAGIRPAYERAVAVNLDYAFSSAANWQEGYFEKSFNYKFKGHKLQPVRLLPANAAKPPPLQSPADRESGLTDTDIAHLSKFAAELTSNLQILLAPEMRRLARAAVATLYTRLPGSTMLWNSDAEQMLLDERIRFNTKAVERWCKVAQIVQKQTSDWLRVGSFTVRLATLADQRHKEIDDILSDLASGWKLDRQAAVDRNILRLAVVEMLFIPEIPFSASINEAVELAKKFSTAESGRFVNGVLGAIASKMCDTSVPVDSVEAPDDDMIDDVTDGAENVGLDLAETAIGDVEAVARK